MMEGQALRRTIIVVAVVVGLAAVPAAQIDPTPARVAVTVVQVLPEMVEAWHNAVRDEAIPAQKKAGVAWRRTYANGPFGQGFTFVTVTPIASYAQYDRAGALERTLGIDGLAKYNAIVRPLIVSTHTTAMTPQPDLSIVSNTRPPAPFVVVQTLHPLPGRGPEYYAIMAADYLPVYRKAGIKDYWFYTSSFGAPPTVMIFRPISKLAELDEPSPLTQAMNKALGTDAAMKLSLRRNALLSSIGPTDVQRFVPELSFDMPATKTR